MRPITVVPPGGPKAETQQIQGEHGSLHIRAEKRFFKRLIVVDELECNKLPKNLQ